MNFLYNSGSFSNCFIRFCIIWFYNSEIFLVNDVGMIFGAKIVNVYVFSAKYVDFLIKG